VKKETAYFAGRQIIGVRSGFGGALLFITGDARKVTVKMCLVSVELPHDKPGSCSKAKAARIQSGRL